MKKYPILVSIPHASLYVPTWVKKNLLISDFDIKNHADLYTEKIFKIPNAHIAIAKITRLILDVNRAPDDIEYECQLCTDGVVVKSTPDGKKIHKYSNFNIAKIQKLIEKYHSPYHQEIKDKIKKEKIKFLIDGHSMWEFGPSHLKDAGKPRADIVLGNRDYTTCDKGTTQAIKVFFEKRGYKVKINDPYSGKFVLGNHCHRSELPGIQIEINRKFLLNQKTLAPKLENLKEINTTIQELVTYIADEFLD